MVRKCCTTFGFCGFVRTTPRCRRTVKPRKSRPSSMWVIRVFASLSFNPRSPRKAVSLGTTYVSRTACVGAVTTRSVGIADQAGAMTETTAPTRPDVPALVVLGSEEPFHAVERDIRQHGGERAALRRSCLGRRPRAQVHRAGFEPAPDGGGEHREPRKQRVMPDVLE